MQKENYSFIFSVVKKNSENKELPFSIKCLASHEEHLEIHWYKSQQEPWPVEKTGHEAPKLQLPLGISGNISKS